MEIKKKTNRQQEQIFGNKVEFLVYKFIAKLKLNVKKKKDEAIKKSNEQFVKSIIKQTIYKD